MRCAAFATWGTTEAALTTTFTTWAPHPAGAALWLPLSLTFAQALAELRDLRHVGAAVRVAIDLAEALLGFFRRGGDKLLL